MSKDKQDINNICGCHSCESDDVCVSSVPAFMNLSEKEILQIAELVEHKEFQNQNHIFKEGDPSSHLLILRTGKIKLVRYGREGEEIVLDIMTPGDIQGGEDLFSDREQRETAVAMGKVGICLISYERIKDLIMKEPIIGIKIMEYLSMKLNQSHTLLEIISTKDTKKKVVMFLLERRSRIGSNILELTQSDIGNSIRLTKETVNRKLSELSEDHLIEQGHGRIELKEVEKLYEIVEG